MYLRPSSKVQFLYMTRGLDKAKISNREFHTLYCHLDQCNGLKKQLASTEFFYHQRRSNYAAKLSVDQPTSAPLLILHIPSLSVF